MAQTNQFYQPTEMEKIALQAQEKQAKVKKTRSHIIFAGDPAFHEDSVEYIPVNRRKRIFQDKENKILPNDLFQPQSHTLRNNQKIQNDNLINSKIIHQFESQLPHVMYSNQIDHIQSRQQYPRKTVKRMTQQREQSYFDPNNIETNIYFLQNPHSNQDLNQHLIHMSNDSQQTQKKNINYQVNTPFSSNVTTPIPVSFNNPYRQQTSVQPLNSPKVNFSYQGQQFNAQIDLMVQNTQHKQQKKQQQNKQISMKRKPQSIFVNQGGKLTPKLKRGKLETKQSQYYEFQQHEQGYQFYTGDSNAVNKKDVYQSSSRGEHNTPQFETNRPIQNVSVNQPITTSVYNDFKSFQQNDNKTNNNSINCKSESAKNLINGINYQANPQNNTRNNQTSYPNTQNYNPSNLKINTNNLTGQINVQNQNNISVNSYKSIPKQNQEYFQKSRINQSQANQQKTLNLDNKIAKNNSATQLPVKPDDTLIMKVSQDAIEKEHKQIKQQNSISYETQKMGTLYSRIRDERQNIFTKTGQEQIAGQKNIYDKRQTPAIKLGPNSRISYDQNVVSKQINRPEDFITDFKSVPRTDKRAIGISNLPEKSESVIKAHQIISQTLLQSRSRPVPTSTSNIVMTKVPFSDGRSGQDLKRQHQYHVKSRKSSTRKNSTSNDTRFKQENPRRKPLKKLQKKTSLLIDQDDDQIESDFNDQEGQQDLEEEQSDKNQSHIYSEDEQQSSDDNQHGEETYQKYLKRKKLAKTKSKQRSQSKRQKKTPENDQQLQDFLKEEQQRLNVLQAKKILNFLPAGQIKTAKLKNKNKGKNKQVNQQNSQQSSSMVQPTVYANLEQLTLQQKYLLTSAGINLIGSNSSPTFANQPNLMSNFQGRSAVDHWLNGRLVDHSQSYNQQHINPSIGANNPLPHPNQVHISSFPVNQSYEQNPQQFEMKFELINKAIYHQLGKFLTNKPISQIKRDSQGVSPKNKQIHEHIMKFSTENIYHSQPVFEPNKQITSTVSFSNPTQFQPGRPCQYQSDHQTERQRAACLPQINYNNVKDRRYNLNNQNEQIYNPTMYNQLKNYNLHQSRRNKSSQIYQNRPKTQETFNDQTRYYSFYHDQDQTARRRANFELNDRGQLSNKNKHNNQNRGYKQIHRIVQKRGLSPQIPSKLSQNLSIYPASLKLKDHLDSHTFQSRQLQILSSRLQILSKQVHQQLPSLRKQIQQNQQQIRKIQTSVLIKNTSQQHHLLKILQKMKLKDMQLQQKQVQVSNRNKEISLYQHELRQWKYEQYGRRDIDEFKVEDFYEKRLEKIKTYNEKLCSKLAQAKMHPHPTMRKTSII